MSACGSGQPSESSFARRPRNGRNDKPRKRPPPSDWQFLRRAEHMFGVALQKGSDWIEVRKRALLVFLRGSQHGRKTFLSEAEYEEAETYRDKTRTRVQACLPEAAARQGATIKKTSACGRIRVHCNRVRGYLHRSNQGMGS